MSKTLLEVGLIVGGIALALLAGPVGLIALQGSLAAMNAMIGIGLTTALTGVGLALRQTPKSVGTANSISFSNGPAPRRVIYGQFQTAGVLTYASFPPGQATDTRSQFLHLVYSLSGHEITSFDAVAINGLVYNFGPSSSTIGDIQPNSSLPGTPWQVNPAANIAPDDFYWEHMMFEFDAGKPANGAQPFPNLTASDPAWTGAFLQRGCAKVHVILRYDSGWPALYPGGAIPNIQFLVTGNKLIDPRIITAWAAASSYAQFRYVLSNNGLIWFQSAGAGVSGSSRPNFEALDASTGATITDNTCVWYNSGWPIQAVYNGSTAPPQLLSRILVNDGWIPGAVYSGGNVDQTVIEAPTGYLQLLVSAGTTGSGHPSFATTVGASTSDGTALWTCLGRSTHAINPSNSALVTAHYLQDGDYGMAVPAALIDQAALISAANVCEEPQLIIWNADNTVVYENRYACDGMFDHSSTRGNVLTSICGSMAGWVVPPGDYWHIFAGAYVTPTVTLTDDDVRGPIKADFRLSRRDIANGVKGTFVPAFLPTNVGGALSLTQIPGTWQAQSFPAYQANGLASKPDYLNGEDGGQIIWQQVQFDFTTSLWRAQRIAKIILMRLRFQETITLPCKLTALGLSAGDTFAFTHPRWGINGGVFEATQCTITIENLGGASPNLGVDLIGRQTDPSVYTFTPPSNSANYGEYSPFGVTGIMSGVE